MNIKHMIAWLTLEGWVPYPPDDDLYTGALKDGRYVFCDMEDTPSVVETSPARGWIEKPVVWDEIKSCEVKAIFEYLQEHP